MVRLGSSDVVRDFFMSLSSASLLLAERALLLFCWRVLGPGLEESVPEDMVVLKQDSVRLNSNAFAALK
jgi:hypothetical protein